MQIGPQKPVDVIQLSADYDLLTLDEIIQDREDVDSFYSDSKNLSSEFVEMALPSLIPLYIFLARTSIDITHEALRLRLEQAIEEPSVPIIRQVRRKLVNQSAKSVCQLVNSVR